MWTDPRLGSFGGNKDFASPPIAFAPNPVECVWVGPLVSDLDCTSCVLGFEIARPGNATCIKPEFRPHKGWAARSDRMQLELQHAQSGRASARNNNSNTAVILTEHTYKIAAPDLEPKERKFVGYTQPSTKIHYEIDFALGAEEDIGCGTSVVGDGSNDGTVSKSLYVPALLWLCWPDTPSCPACVDMTDWPLSGPWYPRGMLSGGLHVWCS